MAIASTLLAAIENHTVTGVLVYIDSSNPVDEDDHAIRVAAIVRTRHVSSTILKTLG